MDKETRKLDETIEGLLHPTEPPILYNLGKKWTGKGAIVEIGSWKGRSIILLTRGCTFGNSKNPKVYVVDTFKNTHEGIDLDSETLSDFKKNIKRAGVEKYITPLIGESLVMARGFNKPIEILFIDGSHDYDSVYLDVDYWCEKLIEGGWVIFHDSDYYGVMKVIKEMIFSGKYSNLNYGGSIIYMQKKKGSIVQMYFALLRRKVLIGLWKDLPDGLKVFIRRLLGKQYKSAPKDVPKEFKIENFKNKQEKV